MSQCELLFSKVWIYNSLYYEPFNLHVLCPLPAHSLPLLPVSTLVLWVLKTAPFPVPIFPDDLNQMEFS
jgi:hypothetical protein